MISVYHEVMCFILPKIVSDKKAVIYYYKKKSKGKVPDLENPITFSEKLQWYKLNHHQKLMEICANKYTVRKYIESCGYKNLLNEIIGVWNSVDDIDWESLPTSFVLKGTHGSGFNLIVKNKKDINWLKWKKLFRSWMRQDNYWYGREWVYKKMPRQIIAEKYLEDETGELRDYKFYCFNGKPYFMQLEVGRNTSENTRNFYDMNWKLLPFGKELPHNPNFIVEQPKTFNRMKKIAADLCKPFSYVRVDLYEVDRKVYFGELTFFPAGGAPDFIPKDYDEIIGKIWDIKEE